ncbi:MAG: serine/threonine protein kinase [Oscillatoria sp. SIO1A7]|nr:serine/threonine protein kinase [Oscillatoria sp. SIO1A7]
MTERPGKILRKRYRIVRRLGSGRLGATFLAEDMDIPDNPRCVVKKFSVLYEYRKGPSARKLLDREGEMLSRLGEHPQIPQLLAYFEEYRDFYFVWEFIEGHDLNYELRSGNRWSETETVALLKEVLEILVFFHNQRFIHRDIKPDNLIRRQSDGKIVILIGSWTFRNLTLEDKSLKSYPIIGTPGYMPPEQARGRPRLNSDIYALGMVAIQALTGVTPNDLPTDPETGELVWHDMAKASDRLANVLNRMVRYDFRDRYQSAREVLYSLELRSKNFADAPQPRPAPLMMDAAWELRRQFANPPLRRHLRSNDLYRKDNANVWKSGDKAIALAAGGAFLGGLTAQLTGAAIGTCLGAIFGYFYGEDGAASSYPASSDGESRDNIWKRGDRLIVFASGGVLLGGLIAQLPGAIMGATLGAAFGLLAKIDTN